MTALSAQEIITEAEQRGFSSATCTTLPPHQPWQTRFTQWIAAQRHGTMQWLERNAARRTNPDAVVKGAQTIICVSLNYFTDHHHRTEPEYGRISRYAWGDDYHDIMTPKLREFEAWIAERTPGSTSRSYVDTGPVLEKPWAAHAGLGWQGKHTNLINRKRGSWFFLGEIITTAEITTPSSLRRQGSNQCDAILDPCRSLSSNCLIGGRNNKPTSTHQNTKTPTPSLCGKCTRCIDICPTQAITAPYQLDARKCISYLTIENKGSIPESMRPLLGNHIYGCDLCQDVCPWNRFATSSPEPAFQPRAGNVSPALIPLIQLTDEQFRERFRGSPIKRIKRRGFLRNVAVALGNSKNPAAIPSLQEAAQDHEELIREHAQWALQQLMP